MTQPEAKLSRKIIDVWGTMGVFCWKVHGGPTQMAGIPDIVGVYEGFFVGAETKMPGGHTSAIQKRRIHQIRASGGLVVVPRSVTEAIDMITHIQRDWDCQHQPNSCLYALGGPDD